MPLNFTAIDFETANRSSASPCAVGLVKVVEGQIVDTYSTLIKPPYPNDWFATGNIEVHGIHPEDVADAPIWAEALEQILGFIDMDDLIAHNASFDFGFLNHELQHCGRPPVAMDRMIDTVALARVKNPGAKLSLDALCTRYGIDRSHRIKHGALLDAELLAQLYIELTGGRQIGLGLADNAFSDKALAQTDVSNVQSTKVFRPVRAHSASVEELARHAEFIAKIKDALWLQSGSTL